MIPPYSHVPTGIYPSGKKAVSTRPLPISFCNDNSLPLNVSNVAFKACVNNSFLVFSGEKSITNPLVKRLVDFLITSAIFLFLFPFSIICYKLIFVIRSENVFKS